LIVEKILQYRKVNNSGIKKFSNEVIHKGRVKIMRNIIQEKSYEFARQIIMFCKDSKKQKKFIGLHDQLLRSATSIGANVEEAQGAISKKEFNSKMYIAYKEARESLYWLKLFYDCGLGDLYEVNQYLEEINEITAILRSITRSTNQEKEAA